jgi:hypothetical protein
VIQTVGLEKLPGTLLGDPRAQQVHSRAVRTCAAGVSTWMAHQPVRSLANVRMDPPKKRDVWPMFWCALWFEIEWHPLLRVGGAVDSVQ